MINRRTAVTAGITALMGGAWLIARQLTPNTYLADTRPPVKLDQMVPASFGEWRPDPNQAPMVVDPTQMELIDRLYQENLNRTYLNSSGHRLMLTIAYGRDQSEGVQLHTPEFCYPASGFPVGPSKETFVSLGYKEQPVVRLTAKRPGGALEPITYWVTMGDHVVNGGARARRDARFMYGFKDYIPDGILFRLSSIGQSAETEYEIQAKFLRDLFSVLTQDSKNRLAGTINF